MDYHFFSKPRPLNIHCPLPKLFAYRVTRLTFDKHFSLSLDQQEQSLNIVMSKILPVKCSGVSPNLNNKHFDFVIELQCIEYWKIFHSKSIGSPSILSKFLFRRCCKTSQSSHTSIDFGFSCILPTHKTESAKTYNFVHRRLKITSSRIEDKYFHE